MKLISYTGRVPVEVDLGTAERKAKAAGKPFVRETRGGTLYLRPGTTASLSEDEFGALVAAAPAALRFVFVHPTPAVSTPEVPEVKPDLGAPGFGFSGFPGPRGFPPGAPAPGLSEVSPAPEGQEILTPEPLEVPAPATTVSVSHKSGKKGKR